MKKLNKNILLGLGSIASIAAPIATVVACGSDEAAPATNPPSNGHKATTTSFTGQQFITAADETKLKKFVLGSSITPAETDIDKVKSTFEVATNFDVAKYNALVNDAGIAFSAEAKNMFAEILEVNKNDPKLAANVIAFTYKTIVDMFLAYMGLRPAQGSDPVVAGQTYSQSDVNAAIAEISGGSVDYKTIADGFMKKFAKQDPIWFEHDHPEKSMTLKLYTATPEGPQATTLTEGEGVAMFGGTMAGTKVVKAITEAAGYKYVEAPSAAPDAS